MEHLSSPEDPQDAMRQPMPLAYIAVHDKTPMMRLLYASSNIREATQFTPSEVIGRPAFSFIKTRKVGEYKEDFGHHQSDSVVVRNTVVNAKDGTSVYMRIIHFSCDDIAFNVAMVYPDMVGLPGSAREARRRMIEQRCRAQDTVYRCSRRVIQACLVLERAEAVDSVSPLGARVVFASRSFELIAGTESSDVQGVAFLSLVATEDVARAAGFLERVAGERSVVIERLRFSRVCAGEQESHVLVEVMAAGSDDGAILLCRPISGLGAGRRSGDGYMSLEEIISSDAETSDIADMWHV
ncbi:hypothetical protein LPJ53_002036 [Coemansia erecta]|uniref:PAS domain-containing protein n=1 Tax=Coemansia erecta TaxID=147472 RepID=A0A9W7Y460_9FUNG|nr:hypothetical protein LPJ53_002036 [Coemansia erecta]